MTMQDDTQDVEAARRRLMSAMRTGVVQDPDALSRDRADAERRGVTVQTLRAARAQGLPLPTPEIQALPQTAPRAAEFLSNPANAAVAHDDTDSMSGVETLLRGVGSRAVNLVGSLGRLGGELSNDLNVAGRRVYRRFGIPTYDWDTTGGRLSLVRSTDESDAATPMLGREAIRAAENSTFGYQPMTTWEETKQQPLRNFIPFALETGLVSAPDMAAAVLALPAYLGARTGEIGQQRAENNGGADATVGDLVAAAPAAAVSSLLERIGTRGIFGLDDVVRGGARGIPAAAGRGALIEAGTEGAQSLVEYTGSNAGTQKGFNFAEAMDQSLAGIVAGGTFGGTVRSITAGIEVTRDHVQRTQRQAAAAEAGGQVVDRLAAIAQASVLRERDPKTFEEFVEHAAEGTPVENVYINAEAFAQAAGPNLPEILATVPEIKEQLDTAMASGGDLRISAGAFAAHIAGAEYAQPMLEHLRVDPFDMSRAQAKEFLANQAQELKAEVEQAMAAGQMDEAFQASADKVREGLMTELETAGRFSADVNGAYAAVVTNFYSTMAARTGMTPEQFAAKYPLRVTNEMPGAPRANTMDQQLGEDVDLVHFSPLPDLEQSDPMAWGRNAVATTREERQRVPLTSKPDWMTDEQFAAANARRGPGRTYFYDRAVRGDRPEASIGVTSPYAYRSTIKRSRLYDLDADPQNLRPTDEDLTPGERASLYEQAIKDAGFAGYVSNDRGVLGGVAVFEPLPLRPSGANTFGQEAISPAAADAKARKLAEDIPGLAGVLPYLTTDEKAKLRKDTAAKIKKLIDDFPDAEEMAAVAYSGRAKRGWYENSAQAILSIFGAKDAPRFAALLAALSPQTSVEANSFNALATWTNWINAGRPADKREIVKIMGESVQGGGTEASVLNAWINNAVTALTTENPAEITLSGPKVNSFMMNLIGVVDEVTNDAWMANYALVEQSVFKKTGQAPGKGPGYIAMNAVARRAAEIVSEKTGESWSAAEVQETVWSWAKTLYEMRDSAGEKRQAQDILAAGGMTADDIASTPDFAVLFVGGVYRRILEAGGYGAELDALDARGEPARRDGGGSPLDVSGTGFDEGDFGRYVDQAAARLEELRARRRYGEPAQSDQLSLFAQSPVDETPLAGQPQVVNIPGRGRVAFGPFAKARAAARDYMASTGMAYVPPTEYAKVDEDRAKRIAQAFEDMKHDPSDPQVAAAYDAMIDETLAQWDAIKKTGLKVEFIKGEDPYAATPRLAILDVVENNHLWVFPTDQGFGSSDLDVSDNPLLRKTGEVLDGRELVANDVFRIVHDYFGHIKDGNGFRADGEENAWQSHAAMYSPLARRAMTTETRGQNSWVNFGPKAEFNRTASASETVYADQKIGLLPEWVSTEGFLGETASYAQADVFYSALERAVLNSPTAKAPAAQWKATLAKTPGVKKEEIEWSGLNEQLDLIASAEGEQRDFLVERGQVDAKGNITREAVLEFLRAGGVRVEETMLGEADIWQMEPRILNYMQDNGGSYEEARREIIEEAGGQPAQFSTYKLPGADDTYRELLLTLPNIEGPSTHWDERNVVAHARFTERKDADGKRVLFLEELQSDWHQKGRDQGYEGDVDDARLGEAQAQLVEALSVQDKAAAALSALVKTQLAADIEATQVARDEAARMDLSESVQENLADGVNGLKAALSNLEAADPAFADDVGRRAGNIFRQAVNGRLMMRHTGEELGAADKAMLLANLRVSEAQQAVAQLQGGIPDAPFRTSWSTLLMKRMIRYAADNGYDKIAWINGNQQNGGQTGGDGSFFYERNLVNTTNDLIKKYGVRVEPVDMAGDALKAKWAENAKYQKDMEEARADVAAEGRSTARLDGMLELFAKDSALDTRPPRELGIQNGFTITPELAAAARQGFALFQPNRGQIAFGPDISQSPSVISLLRTADLSTFLHETGHFFLEVSAHVANQPDAPAEIVADFAATLNWFRPGMTLSEWNAMSLEQRRPYHEQWARGFEAYLFEGRAPSPAMRGIFRRFSAWLKNVYKSLAALNVELTDEVRSVMDRMLASADDIRVAEQARSFAPMMATKPETMTEDEWTRYQELGIDATQEAIETLESRNLRDMRWASGAKDKYLRQLQREAEEQRKVVRAEVTAEVMAEPVNRARAFLRRGVGEDGQPVEGASKLDLDALKLQYGEDHPWTQLRRGGKYGEVAKDGVLPDVVADMFGYPTGEVLIDDLVNAENPTDKIAGLTDQRMLERYGDLSSPEALERAANEAVANDARLKFVAAEAAATAKAVGKKSVLNEAAKTYAASVVNRLILKRLRPGQYLSAQGRAAKEAEAAYRKGDIAGAATAKRNQLINLHVGRAVQDAQKDVEKSMRLFKRIVSAKDDALGRTRDMNIVNAARAILAMYGVGRVKNNPASYMKLLSTYDPVLYADLEPFVSGASGDAKPMTEISYEQFVAMRDTVASLWAMSKRTRQMEIDGQLVDIKTAADALNTRMDEIGIPTDVPGVARAVTDKERQGRSLLGIRAALRRVESWARGMDGADQGPFRRFIWNPISEAADRYRSESATYIRRFRDLLDTVRDELKPIDIKAPEIGYTFGGKAELYHALLHTGNGSNKSKLLLGRKWGKRTADGDLDSSRWDAFVDRLHAEGVLAEKDWTFIQAVWDLMEETKPGAQKAHRHIYGRYFDEIAADPVATPFGTFRGGYVPALTDAFLVQDAALRAEQEAVEGGDSAMFPAASNGFTKARVEDYTRELALDLRLLTMHIDKVLKFTHLGPPVRDVMRLMKNRSFATTLAAVDPTAQKDMLLPWLQRAAKQLVETASKGDAGKAADRFFSAVRSRVGMQLMFANVVNTAQQFTGFSNVLLRVPAPALGHALWRFVRDPKKVSAEAGDISEFLRNRMTSDIFEARQAIKQLTKLDPSKKDEVVDFLTRHAYFMQSAVQNIMDVVSWTAAFDHATARGDSPAEVVRFADSVIRETQGSMAPEDMSRFETGLPIQRLFTQFAGYFNMMANLNATEVQHVARDVGLRKGAGRLFYVYLMGFAVPALVGDAIAKGLRGGWEDEDGDGYLDDLIAWFFSSQARFGLAMVPAVGQVGNALIGTTTGQPYDDRLSLSPAVSVIESTVVVPREVYEAVTGKEEFNRGDTRNALNLLGILTGTPTGALAKPAGYGVGVAQGDIEPTGPVDVARGLVTGAPSPESKVE